MKLDLIRKIIISKLNIDVQIFVHAKTVKNNHRQ